MSDKYLVIRREAAKREKQALRVLLDARGDEGSWLCVQPHYRMRSYGDLVRELSRFCPGFLLFLFQVSLNFIGFEISKKFCFLIPSHYLVNYSEFSFLELWTCF